MIHTYDINNKYIKNNSDNNNEIINEEIINEEIINEENNNIKYIYNYDYNFLFLNISEATKDPREKDQYILPSNATFSKIPNYNMNKEYIIYNKINDNWDILDKIKNIIYFYDINNYNKFLEEYIYYNNPYENKDDIINNYIITNNLQNYQYTETEIPIYNEETQSIYFNNNIDNWEICDFKNNNIILYLYDINNYNKFFKKKNYYFDPFNKIENIRENIENKALTTTNIPNYDSDYESIFFNIFEEKWNIVNNNKIEEYKNKINKLKKINEKNFDIYKLIDIYKKILKKTDWIFLNDIDILTEECINNFRNYRKIIRTELFNLKENLDNINFKIEEKKLIKPELIFKN